MPARVKFTTPWWAGSSPPASSVLTPPEAYEGGNLCFIDQGEPLRLPQGTMAIFPSYMLHKVEPVTRGTRHTLVSWAHGPPFT